MGKVHGHASYGQRLIRSAIVHGSMCSVQNYWEMGLCFSHGGHAGGVGVLDVGVCVKKWDPSFQIVRMLGHRTSAMGISAQDWAICTVYAGANGS
jgi:hypothetical protein